MSSWSSYISLLLSQNPSWVIHLTPFLSYQKTLHTFNVSLISDNQSCDVLYTNVSYTTITVWCCCHYERPYHVYGFVLSAWLCLQWYFLRDIITASVFTSFIVVILITCITSERESISADVKWFRIWLY